MKQFAFSFGPKLEYQFLPTSRWNPFLGAVLNIGIENKSFYGTKDSRTIFGILARAGMRYFVLDQLSIDPTIALGGHFGSGSQTPAAAPQAGGRVDRRRRGGALGPVALPGLPTHAVGF